MYVIKLLVKDRAPLNNHLVLQAFLHQLFSYSICCCWSSLAKKHEWNKQHTWFLFCAVNYNLFPYDWTDQESSLNDNKSRFSRKQWRQHSESPSWSKHISWSSCCGETRLVGHRWELYVKCNLSAQEEERQRIEAAEFCVALASLMFQRKAEAL